MKILSDNLKDSPEIQAYFYDCLKAAHDRMATLAHSEEQAEYPWRTGANQVNVVGVRGICKGVVRSKNLNGWMDDTIYVARINQNGNKEVAEFNASLDYSSGKAPILMEGCYKYRFGIHKQSSYEFKKSDMDDVNIYSRYTDQDLFPEKYRMVKKDPAGADLVDQNGEKIYETKLAKLGLSMVNRFVFDEDTFDTDNVETRNLNEFNLNHRRTLLSASSYKRRTYYRALVSGNSLLGRDANQNNIIDPGETLGWEGDQGIHIHYGGEENEVETNSAGCHVIHGWSEYKRFMALIESDHSVAGVESNQIRPPASGGNGKLTYTLVGAAFFEHFLQSQCSSPLGEPRSQNFGNIHSIEHFSLDQRVIEEENSGTFPISGNTHWHSGIHLITANDREMVLAPMAGEIIAARFSGKNTDDEKIKYGSPNFLLIRHRFHRTIEPVFTLLMNLGEFSKGFDAEIDVPWIKRAKKENVKLKAGVINKLSIPVLPGEKVGYPGSLGGNKGLHFEVFSKANIYENELQPLDVAAHPPTLAALTEFPSVTSFLITKVRPGNSYVLAGQNARFEVESVANGLTAENLAKIRWQIRVISEDGKELVNQQSSQGGVSYLMNFPDDSDFYWAQVIAQPFIEGSQPDPRLVIFRYILPGRIQNAYPVVVPANPKRIADCLKVHFAPDSNSAKKLAAVENCNEASLLLKRELIWSSDQAIRRILDGIILLMDPPWDLGGNKSRKEMDANGFRWDWESFEPYSWWGDAIAKQIPLPASGTKLHYFHPSRFLRSLPLISDSLHWINEASLLEGEKKYAGENYSIKDVGNGSHAIVRKNKDTTFPVETEW